MEKSSKNVTRGVRNNNPANIRRSSSQWRGSLNRNGALLFLGHYDKQFCQFEDMTHGVRALICLLRTYVTKYHLTSIRKVITRYAPPTENYTEKYIAFVMRELGNFFFDVTPDTSFLDASYFRKKELPSKRLLLYALCRGICMQESNYVLTVNVFDNAFEQL